MATSTGGAVRGALRSFGRGHRHLAYCWAYGWVGLAALPVLLVALLSRLGRAEGTRRGRRVARRMATAYRAIPANWGYVPITKPYLLGVHPHDDPANRRDLLFLACEPFVAPVLLLLPASAAWFSLFGLITRGVVQLVQGHDPIGGGVFDSPAVELSGGLVLYVGAVLLTGPASRLHVRTWLPRLLAPVPAVVSELERQLAERIAELAETRAAAVDSREAELRRIERDLHDGAQARLVAMGLTLGAVEALVKTDPERARTMVRKARENSERALTELRDLVRGIRPPVLAERGLVDALRALALDAPLDAEVDAEELPGRPEGPIEAALYFAVAELLTNAARHGDATRAHVVLEHDDGILHCTVWDNGHGGAHEEDGPVLGAGGSGLRGIRRRLSAFDGSLRIESPAGGPTVVTMELPCVLSSPKTSSFFGRGSATF